MKKYVIIAAYRHKLKRAEEQREIKRTRAHILAKYPRRPRRIKEDAIEVDK